MIFHKVKTLIASTQTKTDHHQQSKALRVPPPKPYTPKVNTTLTSNAIVSFTCFLFYLNGIQLQETLPVFASDFSSLYSNQQSSKIPIAPYLFQHLMFSIFFFLLILLSAQFVIILIGIFGLTSEVNHFSYVYRQFGYPLL